MHTILIKHASVADGTGKDIRTADLLICDGILQEVGTIDAPAAETIDAGGLLAAPAFIDMHTHSDETLLIDKSGASHLRQGVLTQAVGNCGYSAAPMRGRADLRRNIYGYVEADREFGPWENFSDYLTELDAGLYGRAVSYVGHGALRSCVMGYEKRPASAEEIRRMCDLLSACMEQGALGLSSGLEYFPGNAAAREEILALCRVVAKYGGLYATHVRNRDVHYEAGFQEAIDTAYQTGVRLQISHAVPKYGVPAGGAEKVLSWIDRASADIDIAFDVIPYTWGSAVMRSILPPDLLALPVDELTEIIVHSSRILDVEIDPDGARELARRSRGTPRLANRLLRRVRDFAAVQYDGRITGEVAGLALDLLEVDRFGLDQTDRNILLTIIRKFGGGPVGLDTLAAAVGEDSGTIEDVYEPYLIKNGFLNRTPRGRTASELAWHHLGIPYPEE